MICGIRVKFRLFNELGDFFVDSAMIYYDWDKSSREYDPNVYRDRGDGITIPWVWSRSRRGTRSAAHSAHGVSSPAEGTAR